MKKIRDIINVIISWLFSIFIYVLYHLLYPLGLALMVCVLYFGVKFGIDVFKNEPLILEEQYLLIGSGILFILNYYLLKFIQEFTLVFNETIRSKMNNEYNINEFTPEEQEDILAQFTPEERKYIEEQMELEDREVKITIHDEDEENSDE